ncbi:MAG TPA: patatin-like phospholipase family protein [Bacteroidales bacterium]|nr:patatin-like phospholipase family protein [Bacteroidales bacterium]
MVRSKPKYKTGLVLSGGGLRGFAHAGIIKALNEAGIFPDVISGTSAGSIVGAFYADGWKPDEIFKVFANKSTYKFLEFIVPNKGLLRMTGLFKIMLQHLKAKTFEELQIPLFMAVTNLDDACVEYISKGDLAKYVIASCTVPIVFQPTAIDGVTYVDGGVLDNLPIAPIENDCEFLIGANVNPVLPEKKHIGMSNVADRVVHMAINKVNESKIGKFDIFIEPAELHNYSMMDTSKGPKMFEIGYKETIRILKEKSMLN